MAFCGSMVCFPGGRLTKEDCSDAICRRSRGLTRDEARAILGAHFSPRRALGLWIAAVRELFEEVGILLATDADGALVTGDPERDARLTQKRLALAAESATFLSILQSENLVCDLARLSYFSHWQTARDPIRFDTRFFLAELPPDQTPPASSREVAHSRWLTPDQALQLFARGELPMIVPTFASLRTLADFDTIESVFKEFAVGGD
jgi:8-oxo-dGTP pyrophosphatase MutT (NUDIX family)